MLELQIILISYKFKNFRKQSFQDIVYYVLFMQPSEIISHVLRSPHTLLHSKLTRPFMVFDALYRAPTNLDHIETHFAKRTINPCINVREI
jgi:hypothetical protein